MKKMLSIILILIMVGLCTSCGGKKEPNDGTSSIPSAENNNSDPSQIQNSNESDTSASAAVINSDPNVISMLTIEFTIPEKIRGYDYSVTKENFGSSSAWIQNDREIYWFQEDKGSKAERLKYLKESRGLTLGESEKYICISGITFDVYNNSNKNVGYVALAEENGIVYELDMTSAACEKYGLTVFQSILDSIVKKSIPIPSTIDHIFNLSFSVPTSFRIRFLSYDNRRDVDQIKYESIDTGRYPLLSIIAYNIDDLDNLDGHDVDLHDSLSIYGTDYYFDSEMSFIPLSARSDKDSYINAWINKEYDDEHVSDEEIKEFKEEIEDSIVIVDGKCISRLEELYCMDDVYCYVITFEDDETSDEDINAFFSSVKIKK